MPSGISIPILLNFIFLGIGLEALWLIRRQIAIGRTKVQSQLLNLGSGALLLVAMKLALADHNSMYVGAALGAAGLAHAASLTLHLRTFKSGHEPTN